MGGRLLAGVLVAFAAAFAAACGSDENARSAQSGTGTTTALELPFPEASVTCDGETTRAGTVRARAQRDGVHLRIENTSGRALGWSADVVGGGGRGASAPPGESTHVLDVPPGTLEIACFDERRDDPSEVPRAKVEVVDPDSLWRPAVVDASCERFIVFADHAGDAEGERGQPVDVVRRALEHGDRLQDGDELVAAGYPGVSAPARVALRREGRIVAVFTLEPARGGGWLRSQTDACAGVGLDPVETGS